MFFPNDFGMLSSSDLAKNYVHKLYGAYCRPQHLTTLEGILPQRSTNKPNNVGGDFRTRRPLPKIGHTANGDQ